MPQDDRYLWQFGLDLICSGEYYTDTDLDRNTLQDSYTLTHARIAFGDVDQRWQVVLRVHNLTDESSATGSLDLPFLAGAYGSSLIAPRSYFIDLKGGF